MYRVTFRRHVSESIGKTFVVAVVVAIVFAVAVYIAIAIAIAIVVVIVVVVVSIRRSVTAVAFASRVQAVFDFSAKT